MQVGDSVEVFMRSEGYNSWFPGIIEDKDGKMYTINVPNLNPKLKRKTRVRPAQDNVAKPLSSYAVGDEVDYLYQENNSWYEGHVTAIGEKLVIKDNNDGTETDVDHDAMVRPGMTWDSNKFIPRICPATPRKRQRLPDEETDSAEHPDDDAAVAEQLTALGRNAASPVLTRRGAAATPGAVPRAAGTPGAVPRAAAAAHQQTNQYTLTTQQLRAVVAGAERERAVCVGLFEKARAAKARFLAARSAMEASESGDAYVRFIQAYDEYKAADREVLDALDANRKALDALDDGAR